MPSPDPDRLKRQYLSGQLRRLRKDLSFTITATALLVEVSQSKLSKIENNRLLPTVEDVVNLVKVLRAPRRLAEELVDIAHELHAIARTPRVVLHRGAQRRMEELSLLTARAATSHSLDLAAVPAGLQTADYAQALLTRRSRPDATGDVTALFSRPGQPRSDAVTEKFLISEPALLRRVAATVVMAEQLRVIADAGRRANAEVKLLPADQPLLAELPHGFVVYPGVAVEFATLSGTALITDPASIREYEALWRAADRVAVGGERMHERITRAALDLRASCSD